MAITDLTGYTWVGNDVITNYWIGSLANITFMSDGSSYKAIEFSEPPRGWDMVYVVDDDDRPLSLEVYHYFNNGDATWDNESYKTIQITGGMDATNSSLIAWLEANGTLTKHEENHKILDGEHLGHLISKIKSFITNGLSTKQNQIPTIVVTLAKVISQDPLQVQLTEEELGYIANNPFVFVDASALGQGAACFKTGISNNNYNYYLSTDYLEWTSQGTHATGVTVSTINRDTRIATLMEPFYISQNEIDEWNAKADTDYVDEQVALKADKEQLTHKQNRLFAGSNIEIDTDYSLPNGYTQLDYVENTATMSIDTGVTISNNMEMEIIYYTKSTNSMYMFGSRNDSNVILCGIGGSSTGATTIMYYNGRSSTLGDGFKRTTSGAWYHALVKYDNGICNYIAKNITDNIVEKDTFSANTFGTISNTIHLFGNSKNYQPVGARIKYARIAIDGVNVKEYVSALHNGDYGFYETIGKTFESSNKLTGGEDLKVGNVIDFYGKAPDADKLDGHDSSYFATADSVTNKQDKDLDAVEGNIAIFNDEGNTEDSGYGVEEATSVPIITEIDSGSTDSEIPSAKAVYELVNSIIPVYTLNDAGGYTVSIGRVGD